MSEETDSHTPAPQNSRRRFAENICRGKRRLDTQATRKGATAILNCLLPGNGQYELEYGATIEWYAPGHPDDADYMSAIWVPVRSK